MTPKEETIESKRNEHERNSLWIDQENTTLFQGTQEKSPTRQFRERYWAALIITGILFYLSYLLLMGTLDKQADFVSQVNTIVKQNTISQEIAKQVLLLRNCEDRYCQRQIRTLKRKLIQLAQSEKLLLKGNAVLKSQGMHNTKLDSLIAENQKYGDRILNASQSITQLKNKQLTSKTQGLASPGANNLIIIHITNIINLEDKLANNLRKMASLYNQEAQEYIRRVKLYQRIVLVIAIIVLALEAFFLFPNIVQKIKEYTQNIENAHRDTQEKNEQITEAYQQLKIIEEVTRLNAEALKKSNINLRKTQEKLTLTYEELKAKNRELEETSDVMHINAQLEAARFFDASMNHFSEVMRWKTNQNLYSWTENFLSELVPYVGGLQAAMYVYDLEKEKLFITGGYAIDQHTLMEKAEVEMGAGLVGQVAKSLRPIYLQELNGSAETYRTQTGTEAIQPEAVFVLPCLYNEQIAGVLEITTAHALEEKHVELLKKMNESIGSHLSTLQDQKRISQLLADSRMAQKELRKSLLRIRDNEERFRKLSEVTQEGILFMQDHLVKDANSVLVNMMGYDSIKELWDKHYINLIAPKYRFEIEDKKMLSDGLAHETQALKKSGETFPIEIQSREVKYNNEWMSVISIRDITEKKRTQKQLEEANRIARLVTELEKKNKDITSSIEYAQRIQEAILPSDRLMGKGFLEHFVLYIPKDIVSGDFYWFAEKNEHALIAAVDCTGHGVPGAFMSIIGYSNLNKIVIEQGFTDPADILTKLDQEVTNSLKQQEGGSQSRDGMDLALCSLNIYEKRLRFAGAYRPLYLIREGEFIEHKGNSFPIGGNFKYKKKKVFQSHEMKLQEGDTLYIFSDGFPDQFGGPKNRKYMSKNFKKLLASIEDQPMAKQKEILRQEFLDWKGDYKQMDDILIIGLRF